MGFWAKLFRRRGEPPPVPPFDPSQGPARAQLALGPPAPLPDEPSTAMQSTSISPIDLQPDHPEYGLTPRRVMEIFRSAEAGYPVEQCDLFTGILERDAHLRSHHRKRISSVAGKQWIWEPGGPRPEDARVARLLEDQCRKVPSFRKSLWRQSSAGSFGYAGTEMDWQRLDGLTMPTFFEPVKHRRFRFTPRDDWRLLTKENRSEGVALEPGKWILSERNDGDQVVRAGLMRTVALLSLFKSNPMKDLLVLSAIFGRPNLRGKYKSTTSPEDRRILKQALRRFGKDGAAVMHESCDIAIDYASGLGDANSVQGFLIKFVDDQVSKLYASSTLMSDGGSQGATHALGSVQQHGNFDLIEDDAADLGATYETSLGTAFVHFNGFDAAPPRLRIHVVREQDPLTRLKVFEGAKAAGVPLSIRQWRTEFQLKPPIDAADTLGGGAAEEPDPTSPTEDDVEEEVDGSAADDIVEAAV